jgi:hypothetical protein
MSIAQESDSLARAAARAGLVSVTAAAIIGAGMVARGEVELPPAKMSAAALAIVNAGRRARGEPPL